MSRFAALRRRPDQWSDAHDRARMRLAERLDGPLGLAESTWLDEHLAGCPACTRDRRGIRGRPARAALPARPTTGAAARPVGADGGRDRGRSHVPALGPAPGKRRLAALPLGALSGLAVVAVVVGVSLLSGSISIYPETGTA